MFSSNRKLSERKQSEQTKVNVETVVMTLKENVADCVSLNGHKLSYKQLETVLETVNVDPLLFAESRVKKIYLDGCGIDDEGASIIAEFLRKNNSVTDLYLQNNKISDVGFALIADALTTPKAESPESWEGQTAQRRNTTLVKLDVSQNKIYMNRITSCLDELKQRNPAIGVSLDNNAAVDPLLLRKEELRISSPQHRR